MRTILGHQYKRLREGIRELSVLIALKRGTGWEWYIGCGVNYFCQALVERFQIFGAISFVSLDHMIILPITIYEATNRQAGWPRGHFLGHNCHSFKREPISRRQWTVVDVRANSRNTKFLFRYGCSEFTYVLRRNGTKNKQSRT